MLCSIMYIRAQFRCGCVNTRFSLSLSLDVIDEHSPFYEAMTDRF